MKRILLLGAGGFIGSHLCLELLNTGQYEITALDVTNAKIQEGLRHAADVVCHRQGVDVIERALRYVDLDIMVESNEGRLRELIAENEIIVNMIAICNPALYVSDPIRTFEIGFMGNLKIVNACVTHKRRLIHFSTCEVYGKSPAVYVKDQPFYFDEDQSNLIMGPVNKHRWIYASGKQLLERVIHAHGLTNGFDYSIIRPFNYIGERIDYLPSERDGTPRVFSNFVNALMQATPLYLVNGGMQRRCYTYIRDATDCHMRIIENKDGLCDRNIFNVGNPHNETTIRDLAILMRETYREHFMGEDQTLSELKDVSGDEFYGEGYDDIDRRLPVIEKARKLTGWRPKYDLKTTIYRIMSYYCG